MARVTSATVKRKRPSESVETIRRGSRFAPKGRVSSKDRVAPKGRVVPPGAAPARGTGEALARLDHKATRGQEKTQGVPENEQPQAHTPPPTAGPQEGGVSLMALA